MRCAAIADTTRRRQTIVVSYKTGLSSPLARKTRLRVRLLSSALTELYFGGLVEALEEHMANGDLVFPEGK